eukprot:Pgem_evm1s3332
MFSKVREIKILPSKIKLHVPQNTENLWDVSVDFIGLEKLRQIEKLSISFINTLYHDHFYSQIKKLST